MTALTVGMVTVDCDDVGKVAEFWSAALDIPVDDGASEFMASLNYAGTRLPRFMFLKVPEPKTTKNRMHLDLVLDKAVQREDEVARLVELGASHIDDKDEWGFSWAVLNDPGGNEFCIGGKK